MKSKSLSRNGNYVERGIGEDAALNKSNVEVDFGNLIWVQLNGQSWLGQVVDEMVVGGNKKPTKKVAGEVLVRLYGSYTYLYVDPIKSQLEYEKIIERYHGSLVNILGEALKQDLLHLKSGAMKTEDIQSKAETLSTGASQGKGNKKSQDMTPSTSVIASAGEYAPSGRRVKVMQALGLMAPPGSPFHPK
ncbi:uncharacterized protein LOC125877222 isoform X1 [Solanum stenotomum]|uniref:uncharacterized protein LOC125877222 isoform X1 n=2 Tax=Solanum stenotomum TaxID=172797 RepID=UPI0020CFF675|nr:uncharacterized protein LOC125877222 isoform X1 [Solanum stenotomum]